MSATTASAITDDGARIHFDVIGDGEPLLLLAGQANSRHWWDPVRPDLAARYRTVAADARGLLQWVDARTLLPASVRDMLFSLPKAE